MSLFTHTHMPMCHSMRAMLVVSVKALPFWIVMSEFKASNAAKGQHLVVTKMPTPSG